MDGMVITHQGIEDIAALEIKELIGAKATTKRGVALFKTDDELALATVAYRSQSTRRVLALLLEARASDELDKTGEAIKKGLLKVDFSHWIQENTTFKVECHREGAHAFGSQDAAALAGEMVIEHVKSVSGFEPKTDLEHPQVVIHLFIHDEYCAMGIDYAGFDLSKRQYRIMSYPPAIKPTVAYALLRMGGFANKKKMLDPFCSDGTVAVEAALFATGMSPNFYRKDEFLFRGFPHISQDKATKMLSGYDGKIKEVKDVVNCCSDQFRHLQAAKKNGKIAGINKSIAFSKFPLEWIDTKFDEHELDLITTNHPRISKLNAKDMEKLAGELFYQAAYILKPKGMVGIICNSTEFHKKAALKEGFEVTDERSVFQGDEELRLLVARKADSGTG